MRSMTGYGKAYISSNGMNAAVELKSVNHRFLDINVNLPRQLGFVEPIVKSTIEQRLSRGRVDANISFRNERGDSREVLINEALAQKYADALKKLNSSLGVDEQTGLNSIYSLPDVISVLENPQDEDAVSALVLSALSQALDSLCQMRETEGRKMRLALLRHIDDIEQLAREAELRYPKAMSKCSQRLRKRFDQLIAEGISEERIAQEIALLADKTAIDEEIVRLKAHVEHARKLCDQQDPSGRSLDFLVQEMNREVNTIASKSQDIELTRIALKAKNTVEKLREQLQNVE
ncbi:MAG: YicC family protein [Clostridiales bacterium]|nr:YicC family protein [Clostridiales bacterium]